MILLPSSDKIRAMLIIVFMSAMLLCVWPLEAQAIGQGGIGGRPAHPIPGNERSRSIFVHTLYSGEQVKDAVEVVNNSSETKRILTYTVDSQTASDGAFACAQAGDTSVSVGSWMTLDQKEVTLPPGAKQTINFTINVPKGVIPGEHNGCVIMQDAKQRSAPDNNGIVLSLRSGIRVAVRVPGDIQKGLSFAKLGMEPRSEKKLLLNSVLKNNGNVSLDTQLDIKLSYLFGWPAVHMGGNFPVLASSEGQYNFEAGRPFWGGWFKLTATAHYNNDPAASLGEGASTAAISRAQWVFIAPDPLAAVVQTVVFVTLLTSAIWMVRRRVLHKRLMHMAQSHTVKAHEDLHSVAEVYDMSWQRLARVNKLKAPYQLKAGQRLTVTPPHKQHRKKPPSRSKK